MYVLLYIPVGATGVKRPVSLHGCCCCRPDLEVGAMVAMPSTPQLRQLRQLRQPPPCGWEWLAFSLNWRASPGIKIENIKTASFLKFYNFTSLHLIEFTSDSRC